MSRKIMENDQGVRLIREKFEPASAVKHPKESTL